MAGTHAVVTDTHTVVANIHKSGFTGRESACSQNHSVGVTCYSDYLNAYHCLVSSQVSGTEYCGAPVLRFHSTPLDALSLSVLRECFGRNELIGKVI